MVNWFKWLLNVYPSKFVQICHVFTNYIAVGVGVVVAVPIIIACLGFTAHGIARGSVAASMMSYSAISNGGGVRSGGLVATLQSIGELNIINQKL